MIESSSLSFFVFCRTSSNSDSSISDESSSKANKSLASLKNSSHSGGPSPDFNNVRRKAPAISTLVDHAC
jgi:hypothetical protein